MNGMPSSKTSTTTSWAYLICLLTVLVTGVLWSARVDANTNKLRVAVAANFREAFSELAQRYTEQTQINIQASFGASGLLATQIQQGAPFALFLSADAERPAKLVASGHALGAPQTYAKGQLVLWNPSAVDEAKVDVTLVQERRFALANPKTAPYGAAAVSCLTKLGLWPQNIKRAVYGNNISQTFSFVATGNVRSGFIALSQALAIKAPATQLWHPPTDCHQDIVQQAVVIDSAQAQTAQVFLDFLLAPAQQQFIQQLGYAR